MFPNIKTQKILLGSPLSSLPEIKSKKNKTFCCIHSERFMLKKPTASILHSISG